MLIPAIAALLLATDPAPLPPAADPVLFVFAHANDEIFIAPPAAALAYHGVPMVVAFATRGERGAPPDDSIAADATARAVATCHHSEFGSPPVVDAIEADLIGVLGGAIHLRPARPTHGNPFR